MAEIAVNLLLNKLWRINEEEVKLFRGVRKDFEYIRDELVYVKAVLTAETNDENDPQLQEWIKQLRNIAYETEDVLDEFILRLGHHQGHGFYHSLYKIAISIKNFRARRRIATEFHVIKSRVNDICSRRQRYFGQFNVPSSATAATGSYPEVHDSRLDAFLLDEAKLVGIEEPKKEIIKLLVDDNCECKIICVVGMGGLGKTTLVRSIYNDAEVKKEFPCRAWITISQSFNKVELLDQLIVQLFDGSEEKCPRGVDGTNEHIRLKEIINDFLGDKRYLIALDDVWEEDGWNFFKLAFPNNELGSRLMLTTRNTTVATSARIDMEHRGTVHHLKSLSFEDSRTLFLRKIFDDKVCPAHLEVVAEKLLRRCEGLPLAVETIGGMLAKDLRIERWEMVNRSLEAELKPRMMNKILSLSYDDLPYHLKPCLLYASIFPQDHLMERMRLIRLWIAEGFVKGINGRTLEEVADGYLNELLNRNLLQIATTTVDARVMKCRIHDLLRDIIVSKARHENFAWQACPENAGPCIVRRLTIHQSLTNIDTNMDISHLRSLLVFGEERLSSNLPILKLSHARFKPLKVLDLQGVTMEMFPKEVIKLYHLRYLSLRDTNVKMIPSSIGKLQYLETFDLRGTDVTELPVGILKLHRLRHLLVYKYVNSSHFHSGKRGFKAPMGIGGLLSLQKLSCIEVNEGNDLIRELGDLKQLRSLRISNLRSQQGNVVCSSIQQLTNLFSLFLVSKTTDETVDLQNFSLESSPPPPSLQRLYLEGRLDKSPAWISSLHNLAKVQLSWSRLQDDLLASLHPLPNLIELQLYRAYDGQELHFRARGFLRLRKLLLYSLQELRLLAAEKSSLPCLEVVQIIDCQSLKREVPEGFLDLINLKSVEFGDMPNEFDQVISVPDVRIQRFRVRNELLWFQEVERIFQGRIDLI